MFSSRRTKTVFIINQLTHNTKTHFKFPVFVKRVKTLSQRILCKSLVTFIYKMTMIFLVSKTMKLSMLKMLLSFVILRKFYLSLKNFKELFQTFLKQKSSRIFVKINKIAVSFYSKRFKLSRRLFKSKEIQVLNNKIRVQANSQVLYGCKSIRLRRSSKIHLQTRLVKPKVK